jgi:hypothetical protein
MPDQTPVNISVLASELASTLRTIHNYLYDIQDIADPVEAVIASTRTLLSGLRENLYTRELTPEEDNQTTNGIKDLERFYHSARRLKKVSDDIANNPSTQDRGILGTQWDECSEDLLTLIRPVSQTLDSLSDMASEWPPVALPTEGQVQEGAANAGADSRIRDGTGGKKAAG